MNGFRDGEKERPYHKVEKKVCQEEKTKQEKRRQDKTRVAMFTNRL